jgi:uncharacterized FlgJ-related protein
MYAMRKLLIILFFVMFGSRLFAPDYPRLVILKSQYEMSSLNWRNIEIEIERWGIKEPDKLIRQIKHETGFLTSRLCLECNNLTGMHYPRKRKTTAIGSEDNGACIYARWQDSIEDYSIWQNLYYKGGDYYKFLSSYATDKGYVSKLKNL